MKHYAFPRVLAGISMLTVLVGACSADRSDSAESPPTSSARTAGKVGHLPLDAYLPDRAEDNAMTAAADIFARSCLRRYGFTAAHTVMPPDSGIITQVRTMRESLFVPQEQARVHGFHRPRPATRQPTAEQRPPAREPRRGEDENIADMLPVLNGWGGKKDAPRTYRGRKVAEYGCFGEAEQRLSEGLRRPVPGKSPGAAQDAFNFVQGLRQRAAESAAKEPRVVAVTKRWQKCYRKSTGLSRPNPYAAARDDRWMRTPEPTATEIRAALAHTRCQLRVGFLEVVDTATIEHEKRAAAKYRQQLRAVGHFYEARVRKADRVTEGSH